MVSIGPGMGIPHKSMSHRNCHEDEPADAIGRGISAFERQLIC